MAEQRATDFAVRLLSLLLVADTLAQPVLEYNKFYIDYGLDNAAICNPSTEMFQEVVDLRSRKEAAIVVKPSHAFDTWRVMYNKHCKFKIKANKGDGLFAVVQKMSLRQNGSECIDFIRFMSENGGSSSKFCGQVNYRAVDPDAPIMDGFSATGKINTEIFISKQPLLPGEKLDLIITYTPYKASLCKYNNYLNAEWSGSLYPSTMCINPRFVCDVYTNCASPICNDEGNCTNLMEQVNVVSDGTGTKVTISAVTTIFLCFIIFVLCLWICRKHKKLCWSPDCAGPPATVSGSTAGMPMERGDRNASNPPYVSSAPMLEVAVPSAVNNKDLPPSYDSLFPNQSNTASP